ncbi:hypothetical protein DAPPUDRAFT_259784 [Daphnia pulex]|uniref:Uncharacterized protein n=1 Tax=Daphnia pulex TaxID=6669 RepID=E9HHV5_DAPPU|nr:hypothetical protein DAPPUDRAFT_259784 [Daphnia pulex]|eukprot:EFX68699.1 hypothetical protein DAPPUDRAFT_259784 [Daphnia pulex]
MAKSLEQRWIKLSEVEKEPYRHLMEKRNQDIEEEIQILDKIIIAKRPGSRSYAGDQLSVQIPQKDKAIENKMYKCDQFRQSGQRLHKTQLARQHYGTANDRRQGMANFIRSKKRSTVGDEVVDHILFKSLLYGSVDF